MHNLERRIAYAQQRYGIDAVAAAHMVQQHIQAGTADSLLTPAQYQRIRAHRFDGTLLRMNRQQRTEARDARRLRRISWMWDTLNPRGPALRKELDIQPRGWKPAGEVLSGPALPHMPSYGDLYGDATPETAQAEHDEMMAVLGPPRLMPGRDSRLFASRQALAEEKRVRRAFQRLRMTYASRRGD